MKHIGRLPLLLTPLTLTSVPTTPILAAEDMSAERIATAYSEAVVAIYDPAIGPEAVAGTGFFVDQAGHVVSNYHVVEGLESVGVKLASGATVEVRRVYAASSPHDLVVLDTEIRIANPAALSDRRPSAGEPIVVVGNPRGLERSVTSGDVSAIRTDTGPERLQITAPVSPGSSGSPVFDTKGEVVGVVCTSMTDSQNINFAIPASHVVRLIASPGPTSTPLAVVFDTDGGHPGKSKPPELGTPADLAAVKTVYVLSDFSMPDWYGIVECLRNDGAVTIAESIETADAVLVYGSTSFTTGAHAYAWADIFGGIHSSMSLTGAELGQGFAASPSAPAPRTTPASPAASGSVSS